MLPVLVPSMDASARFSRAICAARTTAGGAARAASHAPKLTSPLLSAGVPAARRSNTRPSSMAAGDGAQNARKAHKRENYVAVNVPLPASYCVECGTKYRPWRRTDITCSPACAETRKLRFGRIDAPLSRAMRRRAQVEVVDPIVVFDRDAWICQICHTSIPSDAKWPDPLSASMDHIVPLARGGEHSYANCQASHLKCNRDKGVKLVS